MTELVLFIGFVTFTVPYAYVLTRFCAQAYFEEKIEYQRKFFKKFDIPHNAGHH